MEFIRVGEYVRIDNDFRIIAIGIGKVVKINKDDVYVKMNFDLPILCSKDDISKHSKDILDVIENNDLVELEISEEFVERDSNIIITKIGDVYTKKILQRDIDNGIISNVRRVLTHQQFNISAYKVGE